MQQIKYSNRPITKPQIKKIHTLVKLVGLDDDMYRALLFRFDVDSSTELTREKAVWVIETLQGFLKEFGESTQIPTSDTSLIYFKRRGKITDTQIDYILGLWNKLSNRESISILLYFIEKVIGRLYLYIEILTVEEATSVVTVLEKWQKEKEIKK